jgi:hypothetical protein
VKAQRNWLISRNDICAKAYVTAACLDGFYRKRIEELKEQQRRRDETEGHAPTSGTYAEFVGRWQVIGVSASADAGAITNFTTNEPRYMGLVLSARPNEFKWLNGTAENSTTGVCAAPSFVHRSVETPLPSGWKAVTLKCAGDNYWANSPAALTLKALDLAELEWDDGALLHLKRVSPVSKTPPPPRSEPLPPLPPSDDGEHVTNSDEAYFRELQSSVRHRDVKWFADQGGVRVNLAPGSGYTYRPDEVRKVYNWIITPDVERAVLAQDPDGLFKNWQGVMAGDGAVWFDQILVSGHWVYRITAINHLSKAEVSRRAQ